MSIRSNLVSEPNNKSISNDDQLFNARNLLLITLGIILSPNSCGKIQQVLKLILELQTRIKMLKYVLSKYYWLTVLPHQLNEGTSYMNATEFSKIKRINGLLY